MHWSACVVALSMLISIAAPAGAATLKGDPADYLRMVRQLEPGDTLLLAADDYTKGIELTGLHGRPDAWIVIKGPDSGPQPRLLGRRRSNTVEIRECSYVALENLTIDGQGLGGIFGISASGKPSHDIRIEGCTIVGHGSHQSTVAISTKAAAWGWTIRRNRIVAAGTGMYLGDSDGSKPFIGGLIEHNLFLDSKGYNIQIKHQNSRDPGMPGMPTAPQRTILRHNVFLKGELPNESGERPNVLIGALPPAGLGTEDVYEIYGNLFYHNHRESLLQAEGRVSIHDNVFVDCTGDAIHLRRHEGALEQAYVYNNTFYGVDTAVRFLHATTKGHWVAGNLMFSAVGVTGLFTNATQNLHVPAASAGEYVRSPSLLLGEMDLYPLPGKCVGDSLDLGPVASDTDFDRDFNGASKGERVFRGAYAGHGENPGWRLEANIKGDVLPPEVADDRTPPTGSIRIHGGATTTTVLLVDLAIEASDDSSGLGPGAQMRFSNDGSTWSPPEPFALRRASWDLSAFGGTAEPGPKVVFARFRDAVGNWSAPAVVAIEYRADGARPAGE